MSDDRRSETLDAMMKYEKGVPALKKSYDSHSKEKKSLKRSVAKKMKSWRKDLIKLNKGNVHAKDLKAEARRLIKENY